MFSECVVHKLNKTTYHVMSFENLGFYIYPCEQLRRLRAISLHSKTGKAAELIIRTYINNLVKKGE